MLFLGRLTGFISFDFALKRGARARSVRYAVIGPISNVTRVTAELVVARFIGLTILTLLAAETLVGFQSAVISKVNAADYFRVPQIFTFYAIGTFM